MLVYSITARPSFDYLRTLRDRALRVKGTDKLPMMLVGNKHDLGESRQVSTASGKELAMSFDIPFMETSAKSRHNVEEAFYETVRMMRGARNLAHDSGDGAHKVGCVAM